LTHERAPDWRITVTKQHALRQKSAVALASRHPRRGSHAASAQDAFRHRSRGGRNATRREESIQDIPFNISAVSGEALEKANIIDSVEALRTMAGVSIQDRGYRNTGMGSSITIRGINVDSATDVRSCRADCRHLRRQHGAVRQFHPRDIERVEALRDPRHASRLDAAGNVRYIMKKPNRGLMAPPVPSGQTDGSDGYNLNPTSC
jgi:outer membrane receptor protein involved in Fe transport